jgi:hypothetical protein
VIQSVNALSLTFGIYPGGVAGTPSGLTIGPPDDPSRINHALGQLQAKGHPLLVRGYKHDSSALMNSAYADHPAQVGQYLKHGRKLDLVLCFRDSGEDLTGWLDFIRDNISQHGSQLAKIQITEEPNLSDAPGAADGGFPSVRQALVQGVITAKDEARKEGLRLQVGFNAVPSFNPSDNFWPSIAALGQQPFIDALDYVGMDCYPDVFRPVAPEGTPGDLRDAITFLLTNFRDVNLAAGKIPLSVPIHITENGWPTGPERTYEKQANAIETIVRSIYEQRTKYNVTHYELFALRDGNSANPDMFNQFGLLRDDYTAKPAFEIFRQLIAELGS